MPRIAAFFLGCIFIALGRWLYSSPRMLVPGWWPGANSAAMKDFSKFMGIALVFIGASSAIFSVAWILGGVTQFIAWLLGAPTITWLCFRGADRKK